MIFTVILRVNYIETLLSMETPKQDPEDAATAVFCEVSKVSKCFMKAF